jgi:hypothetical protein
MTFFLFNKKNAFSDQKYLKILDLKFRHKQRCPQAPFYIITRLLCRLNKMNKTIDFGIRSLNTLIQNIELEKKQKKKLKRRIDVMLDSNTLSSKLCKGDLQLKLLYKTLARFDTETEFVRSIQQKQFHDLFIAASIRNIYKKDFVKSYKQILTNNPQFKNDLNQNVIVTCPRRFGKTMSVAMFIAAYLLTIDEAEIAVFSPSKRQSLMLLEQVEKFIHLLKSSSRISTRNSEKLFVNANDNSSSILNIRKSFYYPAVISSLKGVSAKTLILEEMAMLPGQVFYEVILPLMQLSETYMIGISTIKDESNFMSRYIKQKDEHGQQFFRVFQFYGACLECRNAGLAFQCNHMDHLKPTWHSSNKVKRIKILMEGQQELANQELSGVSSAKNKNAFDVKDIRSLFDKNAVKLHEAMQFLFIAVDPSGGGSSNFAICSTYQKNGKTIVLGMEAVKTKVIDEAYEILRKHVVKIRALTKLAEPTLVFIFENNLGFEAQHLANFANKNFNNFIIMNGNNKVGLYTNNQFKVGSAVMLKNRLKKEMIFFSKELFSVSKTTEQVKEQLENELNEYRRIVHQSNSDFSKTKETYSGKDGSSKNDDLVISLLLNVYWSELFYTSDKYTRFHI